MTSKRMSPEAAADFPADARQEAEAAALATEKPPFLFPQDYTTDQLLAEICRLAHKHEVQTWLDAKGTDTEKLAAILPLARECLARMYSWAASNVRP